MGFSADPGETWVRWIFLRFVDFMGRFVGFVLGFVVFMGCSLFFRVVRWICPEFVGFMGCSLEYPFLTGVQPVFLQEYFLLDFCCDIMQTASEMGA